MIGKSVKYRAPISPCILSNQAYTTKRRNIMNDAIFISLIISLMFAGVSALAYWMALPTLEQFDNKENFYKSLTKEDF
jgi:hypothetical protein